MLSCRIAEMRNKEVINIKNGERIGFISDLEIDTQTARIKSLIIYGRLRFFGLLGREKDMIIPWKDITLFGDDAVLVHYEKPEEETKSKLSSLLDRLMEEDG